MTKIIIVLILGITTIVAELGTICLSAYGKGTPVVLTMLGFASLGLLVGVLSRER